MELHPFMERDTSPNSNLWYVLSAFGDHPSVRVGHTCTYIPGRDGTNGHVFVIGGANPSGPFSETYVLDLETFSWDIVDAPGLRARYEHACFVPVSQPGKVYVYGGADQGGNHNDMQVFDVETRKYSSVQMKGNVPSPRTYHNTVCVGDKLVVYSGGQCGSDPVGDRQVHCFDATSLTWTTLNLRGDTPKPRHGHLVLAHGNKVYLHGGMSGTHFYDDLHVLDLDKARWTAVKCKKVVPCARAAHGGVIADGHMFVFGGMNRNGALDDMYKLSLDTLKWTKLAPDGGPPPANRLDFGLCTVRLKVPLTQPEPVQDIVGSSLQAKEVIGSQLRLGSGGSSRSSAGSAGSQRSVISVGGGGSIIDATPADLPLSPSHLGGAARPYTPSQGSSAHSTPPVTPPPQCPASPCEQEPPEEGLGTLTGPTKTVEMLLVMGGMDTEGEIFDDTLVYLLKDFGDGEEGQNSKASEGLNGAASANA